MQINFTVEFLAIAVPVGFFLLWVVWFYLTVIYNRKKYSPNNDKGRPYKRPEGGVNPKPAIRNSELQAIENAGRPSSPGTAAVSEMGHSPGEAGKDSSGIGKINPFRRTKN